MTLNNSRRKWLRSIALASVTFPMTQSITSDFILQKASDFETIDKIKLSSNENPYGPSEKAKAAILESLSVGNRYPNALRNELKEELAKKENLTKDHILLSAGSSEILSILGLWLAHKKGNYVTTKMTFPILMMCTETYDVKWKKVDLDANFKIDLNRLEDAVDEKTDAIYLCNPNNPTATAIEPSDLENFCKQIKSHQIILIDEAYIEYTEGGLKNSMAKLIQAYPNILIIRTFSKIYGLAGMRIGYALGNPLLIQELKSQFIISESCVSSAGLAAAIASLKDQSFVKDSYRKNRDTRKYITDHFDKWGVPYAPSQTNFIYYPIDQFEQGGKSFRSAMAKANILCPPFEQDKSNYSRMTIGTQEEMEKVIRVLKKLI